MFSDRRGFLFSLEAKMQNITDSDFEKVVIQSSIPVLIDCWSPMCGPCRALAPILNQLEKEFEGKIKFVQLNIFEATTTVATLGVDSLPTILLYSRGKEIDRRTGPQSKDMLKSLVESVL